MKVIAKDLDHLIGTIAEAKMRIMVLMAGPDLYDREELALVEKLTTSAREQAEALEPTFRRSAPNATVSFLIVPKSVCVEVLAGERAVARLRSHRMKRCPAIRDPRAECSCPEHSA